LDLTPSRPLWAIVTDILINAAAPPGTSVIVRINSFIQTWDPPTQGPHAACLGDNIIRILKAGKKYKTNLAAIRLSPALQAKLPAWYHPGTAPQALTNVATKCLLKNHSVKTIADLIKLTHKIRTHSLNTEHVPSQECICIECA